MSDERNWQNAQMREPIGPNYLVQLKAQRDDYIRHVDRLTRLIDFIDAHPDCQELLRLSEEVHSPMGQSQSPSPSLGGG
jgi:hypothetical protein